MAADGKSLVTAVGSQDSTVWLHDNQGDHQISSEGNAVAPSLSSDGKSLFYLMTNGQTPGYELRVRDLTSDKTESLLPGYFIQADFLIKGYSVSGWKGSRFVRKDKVDILAFGLLPRIVALPRRASPPKLQSRIPRSSCPMAISFFAPSKAARIFCIA